MVPRCVIVAGFPRSGTSWLARGLSFAPGFTYYREPDNHDRVAEAEERFAWLYLTADRDDPAYRELMTRACAGRIATAFTMRDDPGPLLSPFGAPGLWLGERMPALFRRKSNVLVKLVFASLNLDWLTASFPHARQLYVLRHQCGQFESWRRRGWGPRPARLLEIPQLMPDHLQPFADLLRRAGGFWEGVVAVGGAVGDETRGRALREGEGEMVFAEVACGDGVEGVGVLCGRRVEHGGAGGESLLRSANHQR